MKSTVIASFTSLMLVAYVLVGADEAAAPSALAPFGADLKVPARQAIKAAEVKSQAIECLAPANATQWIVENPPEGTAAKLFTVEERDGKNILNISAGELVPARSTVRILLPGDGPANGDLWAKNRASYISFLCKSSKPSQMTFHLLQRGKTAGTFQTGFSAKPGEWQRIILPIQLFDLKSFAKIAGIGFRTASAEKGTDVSIADFRVGGIAYTDDSWKSHRLSISINGDWHFATDPGEQGMKDKWYADTFDDSQWKILKSGLSWQEQGISHYGYAWYRQKIFVPKEFAGVPLTLNLVQIQSDDDTWFNGARIGGFSSEYKYKNWNTRAYTVPPSLIRYGENNTIAIRIWGGKITFIGEKSGLVKGPLVAELDPYCVKMREPGGADVPFDLFDLSDARQGKPFEIVFSLPAEMAKEQGAKLRYSLSDLLGNEIKSGETTLSTGADQIAKAVVGIDRETAQAVYLRGRLQASLVIEDAAGNPLYSGIREMDRLSFAKRDNQPLPALPEKTEDTPYGKLRLVDEIDCAISLFEDPHPYLESGFSHAASHYTPGIPVQVKVVDILGKKARESEFGWFAYRIGRGKLKPHTDYLLRIEYPEDKPRFAPIEIQTGQNFMDVGWRNGTGPDSVYDNWPLSKKWQWYDVIIPLDDQTVGTAGTGSASAENGVWVYFMNKLKPNMYYAMWEGGPAVASMKLYEIDPEKNAPLIQKPKGLPSRVLSFDWERQPDHNPADLVRYAKLMGYNAISPVILKWFFANYSDPFNGYDSMVIDDHDYWAHKAYDPAGGKSADSPWPGKKSQHVRYLEETKRYGIDYIPRVEWGGSQDLPKEAWVVEVNGEPAKPNRFAPWCGNILNPLTWDDLKKFMDHLIKPYVKDNPQLTGMLWRIRCDRMRISYGQADLELFSKETSTKLPPGGKAQQAAWATGEGKAQYDAWWHQKRVDFHRKLVELLKSYCSDMTLYYYNWEGDKFGLILPSNTTWAFNKNLINAPNGAKAVYEKDEAERRKFTAADYIETVRTGNFGASSGGINRADYGIRPNLYKDIKGIQLFAPANYLCYADLPEYLNYFQTADGLAVSNAVPYDEIGSRSINPKYEGNMITPAGAPFSMAFELLPYFHGDARTLNYTVYTYGRGFADAHRRFAQAFLALPAIPGTVVEQGDKDLKVRVYHSVNGTYVGVAYKGYAAKKLTVKVPAKAGAKITNLVTGQSVPTTAAGNDLQFDLESGPMELNAFLVQP
ncbi:MAG TPA: hypothetical protein DCZ94_12105 [Lentisphaeria bacterium]|nr:hypothetical protein [Lentisphaeria bacterium]